MREYRVNVVEKEAGKGVVAASLVFCVQKVIALLIVPVPLLAVHISKGRDWWRVH